MFTWDEIIKIVWFVSLIIDLIIYKKYYEEVVLGPLKRLLNLLQIILGIWFIISIIDLLLLDYGFWECWISAFLLLAFCLLQKYMFIKNEYNKKCKILDKLFILFGSSLLSLFCSIGMGGINLFILNLVLIILSVIIFFITLKKESRKLDWYYLLLNYGNISFYIGWLVL